jgi:hypothetical protein
LIVIALDEDMVGTDDDSVIAQGMRVCLGLFCKSGATLLGAHLTPGTDWLGTNRIVKHIQQTAGNIDWVAMICKFRDWARSTNTGMDTKEKLAAYLRSTLGYAGPLHYVDFTAGPHTYDVKCILGPQPRLQYRPAPNPRNDTITPLPNVFQLRGVGDPTRGMGRPDNFQLVATNAGNPACRHSMPNSLAGFIDLHADTKVMS